MFDPKPTNFIASWSEDGSAVTFPLASLPELTAAEADAVAGDSRKVVYAVMERLNAWLDGLAAEDRPGKLTVGKSLALLGPTTMRASYNVVIDLAIPAADVADEA